MSGGGCCYPGTTHALGVCNRGRPQAPTVAAFARPKTRAYRPGGRTTGGSLVQPRRGGACVRMCLTANGVCMYRTQNRNRPIGSYTVDQILNGSAVITCLLSRSRSDRGFLNRIHLTYLKANNQARNNKCMNRHFQLKEHTEIPGLKRATPEFNSVLSVPDLASP